MKKSVKLHLGLLAVLLVGCPGLGSQEPPTDDDKIPQTPTWTQDVKPILDRTCNECHSVPPQQAAPGTFRLDVCETLGGVPGAKLMQQSIINRTVDKVPTPMPPTTYPEQVTPTEEEILTLWVEQGANCDGDINPNSMTNAMTGDMGNNTGSDLGMNNNTMVDMGGDGGADMAMDMGIDTGPNFDQGFMNVADIIVAECATADCHGQVGGRGGWEVPQNASYQQVRDAIETGNADPPMLPYITPNEPNNSAIYRRVATDGTEGFDLMPADGALLQTEIDVIQAWIQDGAPYE